MDVDGFEPSPNPFRGASNPRGVAVHVTLVRAGLSSNREAVAQGSGHVSPWLVVDPDLFRVHMEVP